VPAARKARRRCLLGVRDVMFRCSSSFEISPREGVRLSPSGAVDPSCLAKRRSEITRGVGDLRHPGTRSTRWESAQIRPVARLFPERCLPLSLTPLECDEWLTSRGLIDFKSPKKAGVFSLIVTLSHNREDGHHPR